MATGVRSLVRSLLVAATTVSLAACDGERRPEPSASPSGATSIFGSTRDYCEVQGLRRLVRDGRVARSRLPSWVDRTEIQGTPRIVDFRTVPKEGHAARLDRLFASPGLSDVDIDEGYLQRCVRETTNADVERTQGGPGYRVNLD